MVAPEHVKGYIYVEAFKQTHVKAAIEGISNLRMGSWSQQMVPIKEMTDVLRVVKEVAGLKVKQWVRIKRTVYKDDLAQVDYVDVGSNQVGVLTSGHHGHPRLDQQKQNVDNQLVISSFNLLCQ